MTNLPAEYSEYVTLVFKADVRSHSVNPLKIETPYGTPTAVSLGDLMTENERLRRRIAELKSQIDA